MIKVGITGIGGYGRLLLDILLQEQRKGGVCIEAAVVSFPEQDAEHLAFLKSGSPHTKIFASLEEAASAGLALDLMVLPVGIAAHKELTLKSLAAGWNVLVEKPLAGSVEDAEAMVRAAEQSDRFVAVGYQDMYAPSSPAMKQALLSGAIGEVESIRVFGLWGRPVDYYMRNNWAGKLKCNGQPVYDSPFNNGMAHYLNQALYLAGADLNTTAMPVSVEGSMWRAHDIESCDTAVLKWATAGGPEVGIFFSHLTSQQEGPEMVIQGTEGMLRWQFESHWELQPSCGAFERHRSIQVPAMRSRMVRQVLDRVHDAGVSIYTPAQALEQVRAVHMAHREIGIESFSPEVVRTVCAVGEAGVLQEWLEVDGLKQAGLDFLKNNGALTPDFCSEVAV